VLGELYLEAAEAAAEVAVDPQDNFGQAHIRRWLKTDEFSTLCVCADVEEAATARWFRTIIEETPEEASRLAGRLQDMLSKYDVCEADRELEKVARIEYRVTMGLKLMKKDYEYVERIPGKLDESKEARRRRLSERGMREA
jgi:hypothetical protein